MKSTLRIFFFLFSSKTKLKRIGTYSEIVGNSIRINEKKSVFISAPRLGLACDPRLNANWDPSVYNT